MIFDLTRSYVPEAYRESRDYRVFLRMLGMLVSVNKDNIDSFTNLYSADSCPAELLPLLGDTIGYKYNESLSIEANRIIIKYYPILIRNRGNELGIKLAIALSTNIMSTSSILSDISTILVQYDRGQGVIKIYYDYSEDLINWDLLNLVRPLGMKIIFISSEMSNNTDEFQLKAYVKTYTSVYNPDDSQVNKSKVGFSTNIIKNKEEE